MKSSILIIALFMAIAFTSCNQVKLENSEAEGLIKKTLELPKTYARDVGLGDDLPMFDAGGPLHALQSAGLITYNFEYHGGGTSLHLTPTEQGKPYFLGQNSYVFTFKIHDIDFDQITGISVDKETKIATVRYTLKATNVTPVARALSSQGYIRYSLDNPLNGELIYKKFDNGWQLQSDQNKSSNAIVNEMLKRSN